MPKAIDMALRQTIVSERQSGLTLAELAVKHQVGYTTVQRLCARYKQLGQAGLQPAYHRCGRTRPGPQDFIFRAVRCYKTWHPSWGAEKIRTEMLLLRPQLKVPPTRTIQQWFHYSNQAPKRDKLPRSDPRWAKATHQVWQIDAKEEMQTQDGVKNCWLNITDEFSGAILTPPVFPPEED